jgi:hypothetical protein
MGLFDIFSNDSAEKARDLANAGATKGYSDLSTAYGQGRDALTANFGAAGDLIQKPHHQLCAGRAGLRRCGSGRERRRWLCARQGQTSRPIPAISFQMDQGCRPSIAPTPRLAISSSGNADTTR